MKRLFKLFIILSCLPLAGYTQQPGVKTKARLLNEFYLAGDAASQFNGLLESAGGRIIASGWVDSADLSSQLLFVMLDKKLNALAIRKFGGKGNDRPHSLIQTYDAGFAVAGITENGAGMENRISSGSHGWLLKLDETGNFLWDRLVGDELFDIAQLQDGSLVTVGVQGDQAFAWHFSRTGAPLDTLELPRKMIPKCIKSDYKGNLVIAGESGNQIICLETNESLNRQLIPKAISIGNSCSLNTCSFDPGAQAFYLSIFNAQGPPAILKFARSRPSDQSRTLSTFFQLQEKKEFANGYFNALPMPDGTVMGVGYSTYDNTVGHCNPVHLITGIKTGAAYEPIELPRPGVATEYLFAAQWCNAGQLLVAGSKNKSPNKYHAWLALADHAFKWPQSPEAGVSIQECRFQDDSSGLSIRPDTLEAMERAYFALHLKNNAPKPLYGLWAELQILKGNSDVNYFEKVSLTPLPGNGDYTYGIPLYGTKYLGKGMVQARITVHAPGNARFLADTFLSVATMPAPVARLKLDRAVFSPLRIDQVLEREQPAEMRITVSNTGFRPAYNIQVVNSYPYLVEAIGDSPVTIDTLNPGDSVSVAFKFKVNWLYPSAKIWIACTAREAASEYSEIFGGFWAKTGEYLEVRDTNGAYFLPFHPPKRNGGNSIDETPPRNAIEWTFVSDTATDRKLRNEFCLNLPTKSVLHMPFVILKAKVYTSLPKDQVQNLVKCFIAVDNGKPTLLEKDVMSWDTLFRPGKTSDYLMYWKVVQLKKGMNTFSVQAAGFESSGYLTLNYSAPNFHLFSIAVPDDTLKAPVPDAQEIAEIFSEQKKGGLYDTIATHIYTERTLEGLDKIQNEIQQRDIHFRGHERKGRIGPWISNYDYLLFYVSSHGEMDENGFSFTVASPDGQKPLMKLFSEFMQVLRVLQCQQYIIIIDACYSGGAKSAIIDSIDIKDTLLYMERNKCVFLASCAKDELSKVDPEVSELSLFTYFLTKAIKEAALPSNTKNPVLNYLSKSGVVTLGWLCNQIDEQMKQYNRNHPNSPPQNFTTNHLRKFPEDATPIYYRRNK